MHKWNLTAPTTSELFTSHLSTAYDPDIIANVLFINQGHEPHHAPVPTGLKVQGVVSPYLIKRCCPGASSWFHSSWVQAKRFATLSMGKEETSVGGGLVLLDDDDFVFLVGGKLERFRFWVSAILDCCERPAFVQTSANHD